MIYSGFPRYTEYNPRVPVWRVTPNRRGCIHRFFDTSPISPSGRYLALFQLPSEDRQPEPGEAGNIVLVDLHTGEDIIKLLSELSKVYGATVISATHDHKMLDASDRILWIKDGSVDKLQKRSELDIRVGAVG